MFEKYGEFDSYEEINEKAEELLSAGEEDAVRELAKENGLDLEDAEDYITAAENRLCTAMMAAIGKLNLEEKDLEIGGVLKDWTDCIRDMCVDVDGMAAAVRKKKKKLAECMAALIRFSFENKVAPRKGFPWELFYAFMQQKMLILQMDQTIAKQERNKKRRNKDEKEDRHYSNALSRIVLFCFLRERQAGPGHKGGRHPVIGS